LGSKIRFLNDNSFERARRAEFKDTKISVIEQVFAEIREKEGGGTEDI